MYNFSFQASRTWASSDVMSVPERAQRFLSHLSE